ncbi:MAG: hypothetical protein IJU52_02780, partial [Clostridia bacterium]|nr:hypothetical protein [Clostridia bacterium]
RRAGGDIPGQAGGLERDIPDPVGKKPPRGFWRTQSARGKAIFQFKKNKTTDAIRAVNRISIQSAPKKRRTLLSCGKSVFFHSFPQ